MNKNMLFYCRALKPDAIVALHNGDTPEGITVKKVQKITEFNKKCLNKTLEESSKDYAIIGVIEGSYDQSWRLKEAKSISNSGVDGYCIDGFHNNGTSSLDIRVKDMIEIIINQISPNVKQDKPKFFFGMCEPKTVLKLGMEFTPKSYIFLIFLFSNGYFQSRKISKALPNFFFLETFYSFSFEQKSRSSFQKLESFP